MLSWLKSSPDADHPLADPRTAKRTLEALDALPPLQALEKLLDHLDAAREAENMSAQRVLEIVELVDASSKPHQQALTREFLTVDPENRAAGTRIAHVVGNFWDGLARAYRMLLEMYVTGDPSAQVLKPRLAIIAARALRAFNLHLKWRLLRYAPLEPVLWGAFARVYQIAERHGIATTTTVIYPGPFGESSVRREMLKAMMLAVSSTDSLPKRQIEIVERLCAQFSEFFTLQEEPAPGVYFHFDLDADRAPARASSGMAGGSGLRFFGPSAAAPHLKKLAQDVRVTGGVPPTVNLGGSYPTHDVVQVLEHLAHYWSPIPPTRKEKRRDSKEKVEAVHGLNDIIAAIDADEFGWNFDVRKLEDWVLADESSAGIGATVPTDRSDWLAVGEMVGVRYLDEGIAWGVGIVRRLNLVDRSQRQVGIELLSRGAIRVVLSRLLMDGSPDPDPKSMIDALMLPSPAENSIGRLTAKIAVRPGAFDLRDSYGLMLYGMDYLLVPKGSVEHGADFVIAEYRLLVRSSD